VKRSAFSAVRLKWLAVDADEFQTGTGVRLLKDVRRET
jgi:hypothetical protein